MYDEIKTQPNKMFGWLFREKTANALLSILNSKGHTYNAKIAKEIDCSISHLTKIFSLLEKARLVKLQKTNRINIITLTDKGKEIAEHISKVKSGLVVE